MGRAPRRQERRNAHEPEHQDRPWEAVTSITLQHARSIVDLAAVVHNSWPRFQEREDHLFLTLVGRPGFNGQRNTIGIGDHVALAAIFPTIRRVRPGVRPPFIARTLAQSITSRSRFRRPCSPSNWTIWRWAFFQTPATVHSWKRRQQVDPDPHPISSGSDCQPMPSQRTNKMPTKQSRSAVRGRPPLGEAGCTGKWGAIPSQSSSVSRAGIRDLRVSQVGKKRMPEYTHS